LIITILFAFCYKSPFSTEIFQWNINWLRVLRFKSFDIRRIIGEVFILVICVDEELDVNVEGRGEIGEGERRRQGEED